MIRNVYITIILCCISITAYIFCFYNFPIPSISTFQIQNVSTLLENRIRDMATIFVLSLTIIIFTLNSIKDLKLPAEKHDELIQDALIIPLMIYLAVNLFIAVLTSYTYETLLSLNEFTIFRTVSLIYYLLIADILFIVVVFIKVFRISNPNFLLEKVLRNFINDLRWNRDTSRNKADIELLIDMAIRNNDMRFFNRILDIFYNNYGNR